MNQKPKIQYIGQFYVYGSEARALEQQNQTRKPKTTLPVEKLAKIQKIYVDPVALIAIVVSVFMLATMIAGVRQLYDRAVIRDKAETMGLIPKAEAEHMTVTVTAPEIAPEPTWWENAVWFVKGMFA